MKQSVNYVCKMFVKLRTGAALIKLFMAVSHNFCNKLECLSLASLSSQVHYLGAKIGAYPRVEHLKGVSLG